MASTIVIFNVSTNRVIDVLTGNFNSPDYAGRNDVDLDPNLSQVSGNFIYWKRVSAGTYGMQTAQEIADTDAAIAAAIQAARRAEADNVKDDPNADGVKWRALALMLLDEFNVLRQRHEAESAAVAGASSLANLKTAWAAIGSMPDRTIAQMKTAYSNKTQGPAD